jgi:dTDP-4-dehydrorhamnose reductase
MSSGLGRLVITGAGGQLGSLLAAQAIRTGRGVLARTSSEWDITDPAAAAEIIQSGDVVLNCAAYTNVDGAETDEARAYAVNATAPEYIARACARVGAQLIHVSTDYVFNGDFTGVTEGAVPRPYEPSDPTGPQGVYAASKLAGEKAVLAALPEASQGIVVRTAWVYTGGVGRGDFVAVMQRLAAGDGPVKVVDDQVGSPTYAADLAAALLELADRLPDGLPGGRAHGRVLHAANEGVTSRFEQARAVFEESGADPQRVQPCSSDEFPRPAARPPYSALSGREWAAAGLTPLRPWRSALVAALAVDSGGPSDEPDDHASNATSTDRPLPSTRD